MLFIVTDEILTPALCRSKADCFFIFGDNWAGWGRKGQAIIRDEPNAVGVPTKRYPAMVKWAFLSDDQYNLNVQRIEAALEWLPKDAMVYVPINIGLGNAKLDAKAPRTYAYLRERLKLDNEGHTMG